MDRLTFQANICNQIIENGLLNIKLNGFSDEESRLMLDCIGRAFIQMSFGDKPIEYYLQNMRERYLHEEHDKLTQRLYNLIDNNKGC